MSGDNSEKPIPNTRRLNYSKWSTAAIVLAFAALCTWIQYTIRIDFGPDEPYHLEYIHTIAFEQRLPEPAETHAVQHPPLYYGLMAVLWRAAGADQRPLSVTPGPDALPQLDDESVRARHVLRFASTLFGCLTLLLIARLLIVIGTPAAWRPWILLAAAAGPMLQYVSSVVNNEGWSILYSTAVCLAIVKIVKSNTITMRQAAAFGLLIGLATWVKQTALFAAPIALWVVWATGLRDDRIRRTGVFAFAALSIGVWWPVHNRLVSGAWFPSYTRPPEQPDSPFAYVLQHPREIIEWMRTILETSFLPNFSWAFIPRHVSTLVVVIGVVLIAVLYFASRTTVEQSEDRRLCALAAAAVALIFGGIFQYTLFIDWRAQVGGRYLLNAISWVAVLAGLALPRLARSAAGGRTSLPIYIPAAVALFVLFDLRWWYLVGTYYADLAQKIIGAGG